MYPIYFRDDITSKGKLLQKIMSCVLLPFKLETQNIQS